MNYQSDFLMSVSALYRSTQKYFDRNLAEYGIGSGQLYFLFMIYENEGIPMQKLSSLADMDKGTITKSVRRLLDEGYAEMRTDESDKRIRRIYTTEKTAGIIHDLYRIRNSYVQELFKDIPEEKQELGMDTMQQILARAQAIAPPEGYSDIKFGGVQKLTLLDYPGQVAATLFTVGCNMRCPFCHNRDLVFVPENFSYLDPEEVLDFLRKRQGILDAVCITGGEPLLQPGLKEFVREVHELGYKVKVDTNGLFPKRLKELVETGTVDYIAMDVKNRFEKYGTTTGLPDAALTGLIQESMEYLLNSPIDYEFRTTVVREYHTKEDLVEIAKMIQGAKHYYLQQFVDSGRCISEGLHAYDEKEMRELLEEVKKILPCAEVRGV